MATEVELKLAISQDAAEAIVASRVIPGKSTKAAQRSVYFDTPDQQLAKAGLTLRIRTTKGKRIQTVKAGGESASGLFARSEWEQIVESDTPVIDDTTPVRVLVGDDSEHLAPLFEVNVERRTWIVIEGESEIEVVLDRGNATMGEIQTPICEIELELKRGDPNVLFALARRIDA